MIPGENGAAMSRKREIYRVYVRKCWLPARDVRFFDGFVMCDRPIVDDRGRQLGGWVRSRVDINSLSCAGGQLLLF